MQSVDAVEICKEVAFGASVGLVAGYVSKKVGSGLVTAAVAASFVALRAAIFEGRHLATWSPLARDDPAFTQHLIRTARREAMSGERRIDWFLRENAYVLGGFTGGVIITSAM